MPMFVCCCHKHRAAPRLFPSPQWAPLGMLASTTPAARRATGARAQGGYASLRRYAARGNGTEASGGGAKRARWLAGVALPCGDRAGLEETGRSVLAYAGPSFHWRINIYDAKDASCVPWANHHHVWVSHVPGYMTLFWKKVLVPALTNLYDRIFILDNDVRLTPQLGFSPGRVDRWFARTGAMILTTSVIAHSSDRTARSGTGLRQHHLFTADCGPPARAASHLGPTDRPGRTTCEGRAHTSSCRNHPAEGQSACVRLRCSPSPRRQRRT